MNNKTWTQTGSVLDGKYLSTKISGGYVGAYFGFYAFAKTPAIASFDWTTYQKSQLVVKLVSYMKFINNYIDK